MVYTFVYCNGLVLWLVVLDVVHRISETEQLHLKIFGFEQNFSSI